MVEYCVTGGTGFIAAYLIKSLLLQGHTVRATVRDPGGFSTKTGRSRAAEERLKLFKADLMIEGSIDVAVNGVDGVFHTACPVFLPHPTDDVPGRSVRRVVLTSSCSTIRYREDVQQVSPLNESHWSDPDYCKRYNLWYAYAKTIAENTVWEVAKNNSLDLVAVHPSFVVGPLLAPQPTSTVDLILSISKGTRGKYPNQTIGFVHIDDVVAAHILAMEEKKASGRLICTSSVSNWSDIVKMLKDKYPRYPFESKASDQKGDDNPHDMDCRKITELGFSGFKTVPQMFDDCIVSLQEKGFS